MDKITTYLWFDFNKGEEAVSFYKSVFKDFKVGKMQYYPKDTPGPEGLVMTIPFSIFGQDFVALNGGPDFKFNMAVSFAIICKDQAEVDYYWEKLSDGGEKSVCGWLTDKFGVAWQVVPEIIDKLHDKGDKEKSDRMMLALLKMTKLDVAELENAYYGR